MQKSNTKYIIHRHEKSAVVTLGEVLNVLLICASVYYTYRMLFTPCVQRARVDWQSFTAEVMINGKEYYLHSIEDEIELKFGYVMKFDEYTENDQRYYRLVIDRNGNVTEVIQKNKVRTL